MNSVQNFREILHIRTSKWSSVGLYYTKIQINLKRHYYVRYLGRKIYAWKWVIGSFDLKTFSYFLIQIGIVAFTVIFNKSLISNQHHFLFFALKSYLNRDNGDLHFPYIFVCYVKNAILEKNSLSILFRNSFYYGQLLKNKFLRLCSHKMCLKHNFWCPFK